MRKAVKIVYTYDELSEEAKERAIEEISAIPMWEDWSDEEASLKAVAEHIGARLDYSVGAFTYSYVSFDTSLDNDVYGLKGVRAYKWIWNNWIESLFRPRTIFARLSRKHRHSKCSSHAECALTGYYMDDTLIAAWENFCKELNEQSDIDDFIVELESIACRWWQEDMEYRQSRECIEEMYVDSYEFLEDGSIYE